MRPRTPIRPQPIELVNQTETTHIFTCKFINIRCVMEIEVSTQNLIAPLTREDVSTGCVLLDVLTEKPHRCTRPHSCRVIRFEGVNHIIDMRYTLLHCKLHLSMFRIQILCDCTSCFEVGASLKTDGEGLDFS